MCVEDMPASTPPQSPSNEGAKDGTLLLTGARERQSSLAKLRSVRRSLYGSILTAHHFQHVLRRPLREAQERECYKEALYSPIHALFWEHANAKVSRCV